MFNLRNFIFGSIVVGCTVATSASALQCQSEDCLALGYSKATTANCEKEIKCPYDDSYTACIQLKDEFIEGECPEGAVCKNKYKITDCVTGYEKSGDACVVACTGSSSKPNNHFVYSECTGPSGKTLYTKTNQCETGYIISKDNSSCYDKTCVFSGFPQVTGAKVGLTNIGYIILYCEVGYQKTTNNSGCITDCTKASTQSPTPSNTPTPNCQFGCYDIQTGKCCDSSCTYAGRTCAKKANFNNTIQQSNSFI